MEHVMNLANCRLSYPLLFWVCLRYPGTSGPFWDQTILEMITESPCRFRDVSWSLASGHIHWIWLNVRDSGLISVRIGLMPLSVPVATTWRVPQSSEDSFID